MGNKIARSNIRRKAVGTSKRNRLLPRWVPLASFLTLAILIGLTVNFRAITDLSRESAENERLNREIKEAMIENITMQEQIHYLKNDPDTIEREAKKYGFVRKEKEFSMPAK